MHKNIRLSDYLRNVFSGYKVYFGALILIAIFASFFEVSVQYKVKEVIDMIADGDDYDLGYLLVLFALFKFSHHGMFFIVRLLDLKYKPGLVTMVTKDLYQLTINHSLHWFDSRMSGEIADKINSFQTNLAHLITYVFRALVVLSALILGIVFLAKVHILPALVELAFIALYAPLMFVLLSKQMKLQESYVKASQETTGIINDSISNIFSIKTIGNIGQEFKMKLMPALHHRQKWDKKTRRFDAFWVDNTDTFMVTLVATVQFALLAYLFKTQQITAGGFAFVSVVVFMISKDLDQIIDRILFDINPQIAAIRSSYSFVSDDYGVVDKEGAKDLKEVRGEVVFDQVHFAYDKGRGGILNDFNLKIKAGEKIGVVGHSGAGKTTLIKSLLRYFEIDDGDILIDGNKISDITQESLRANLSVIPQDIMMFHRSIMENLLFVKPDADMSEIIATCKRAQIHDDIEAMSKGYDTVVGERGVKLSGGQRQRIAIARAVLKDAPILILDEATSSLDSKTEQKIQDSLNVLIEDNKKTVIAIAHRLSTLKHMDRIIVLDQGRVVEEGNHEDLLKNKESLYKRLWELQEI